MKDTPSNVVYVDVVNKPADSINTMYTVMSELRTNDSLWKDSQPKPMVGDAKTYNHMVSLIAAHKDFEDIIPFPGDWHLLKNFQPVLMKIFYDAGLKQPAQESGFRAETLTSLAACSNFKRTNNFLLQAQEAMFRQLISCALAAPSDIELRKQVATTLTNSMSGGDISASIKEIDTVLSSTPAKGIYKHFLTFLQSRSSCDHLWLFWVRFVLEDCMAYLGLFIAVRSRNWQLRLASLKMMAPLFMAFDRPTYRQLVPHHLHTLSVAPQDLIDQLADGSFAVSLSEHQWHSVALDEAHESKINKACKTALVRPTETNMRVLSNFLAFRAKQQNNLMQEIFPERECSNPYKITSPPLKVCVRIEDNIRSMSDELSRTEVFTLNSSNRQLSNFATGQLATPECEHDLLHF